MTYKDRFVAEIKSGGKILRIQDDTVYLPFGSEYSLLFKNLNSQRASVNIEIDGQDVLDKHSLIIDPNTTSELMGFLRGATATNKFKFIQKTKQIQDHRGDRIDDGLIRIEFAFEKPQPKPWISNIIHEVHHHYENPMRFTYYHSNADWSYSNNETSGRGIGSDVRSFNYSADKLGFMDTPQQDEGITVKGQEINQEFRYSSIGELEESQIIIIKLRGLTSHGVSVSEPLTIQDKLTCSSCGTKSKSSAKYCPNCGTYLR